MSVRSVPTESFLMLRNRKIAANSWTNQHEMAALSPESLPNCSRERFGCFFTGDVRECSHTTRLTATALLLRHTSLWKTQSVCGFARLNRYEDGCTIRRKRKNCLLVFGPHPCFDRVLDVRHGFLLVAALGHASWQGRAFNDDPAVFGGFHGDVECHEASQLDSSAVTVSWEAL